MRYFTTFIILQFFVYSILAQGSPTVILVDSIAGLVNPMKIAHAGDNSHRLFVAEKGGSIKVFSYNKTLLGTLLTLSDIVSSGEQGLLSLAFHPKFKLNGYFYVYYNTSDGNLALDRYRIPTETPNQVSNDPPYRILSIPHPANTNHNGGDIHFGKDGYLYISTGDGGGSGDPNENALNLISKLGKLLRIDVDNGSPYSNPSGNHVNEIFCFGLRNPFRWNFDRHNGDFYLGDVGQNAREEINYAANGQLASKNFGWDCKEGNINYNFPMSDPSSCSGFTFTPPVHDYAITSTEKSIIGGAVYRGYKYPDLQGWYLAIDYYSKTLRKFDRRPTSASWTLVPQTSFLPQNITSFGESEDGELFITSNSAGKVYQLGTATNVKTVHVFSGNGNWSDTTNWKSKILPSGLNGNHVVVIKPMKDGICNLDINASLPAGTTFVTEPGSKFIVNNNKILWLKSN